MSRREWPAQENPLYRYKLNDDGSVTCTKIERYEVKFHDYKRREYRYPLNGIRSVREENIGQVKHNVLILFEDDMKTARRLFEKNLRMKCVELSKQLSNTREMLKKMEENS